MSMGSCRYWMYTCIILYSICRYHCQLEMEMSYFHFCFVDIKRLQLCSWKKIYNTLELILIMQVFSNQSLIQLTSHIFFGMYFLSHALTSLVVKLNHHWCKCIRWGITYHHFMQYNFIYYWAFILVHFCTPLSYVKIILRLLILGIKSVPLSVHRGQSVSDKNS